MDLPKTPMVRISSRLAPAKAFNHKNYVMEPSSSMDDDEEFSDPDENIWDRMKNVLTTAMQSTTATRAYKLVDRTLMMSLQTPTEQNKLRFLYAFSCYGQSLWEKVHDFRKPDYRTVVVCYEADGSAIFDSSTQQEKDGVFWQVVHQDENGRYSYAHVGLKTPQPFTFDETKPSLEDYRLNTRVYVPLYGITSSPHKDFVSTQDIGIFGPQAVLQTSSFMRNQITHPSHVHFIRDMLRNIPEKGSCFEEHHPYHADHSFHVCTMLEFPEDGKMLGAQLFIRLSLEPVG